MKYRILINESIASHRNSFYVENNHIWETESKQEVQSKYLSLCHIYPKSRLDIVINPIEYIQVDINDISLADIDRMLGNILN